MKKRCVLLDITGLNSVSVEMELRMMKIGNPFEYKYNIFSCIKGAYTKTFSTYLHENIPELSSPIILYRETMSILTFLTNQNYEIYIHNEYNQLDKKTAFSDAELVLFISQRLTSLIQLKSAIKLIHDVYQNIPVVLVGSFPNVETNIESLIKQLYNMQVKGYIMSVYNHERIIEVIENVFNKASCKDTPICSMEDSENYQEERLVDWSLLKKTDNAIAVTRTSISCPFSCAFCSHPNRNKCYRIFNINAVLYELNMIDDNPAIKTIYFEDDVLNLPVSRFHIILNKLSQMNRYWFAYARGQFLDEETVKLISISNCIGLYLGIESGSEFILSIMHKKVTLNDYKRMMTLLNQYNITTVASFVIGFVGETEDTIKDTIRFINETGFTFVIPLLWYYSHNSPASAYSEQYALSGQGYSWTHFSMDSIQALNYINKMLIEIKSGSVLPIYDYTYWGLIKSITAGLTIKEIQLHLKEFNKKRISLI